MHEPLKIEHPCLLIRIPRAYKTGMSEQAIYHATRGTWVLGKRREKATYAMAVVGGTVLAVFRIESWHRAQSTPYPDRVFKAPQPNRCEFVGRTAETDILDRYIGKSVHHYFTPGARNPVQYVNCDSPTRIRMAGNC
jgi:uncharacterized protein